MMSVSADGRFSAFRDHGPEQAATATPTRQAGTATPLPTSFPTVIPTSTPGGAPPPTPSAFSTIPTVPARPTPEGQGPQLVVVDNDSGAVVLRHLIPAYSMALSPDGAIALVTRPDSGTSGARWRVEAINVRARRAELALRDASFDGVPMIGWSPDGTQFAVLGKDVGDYVGYVGRPGATPTTLYRLTPEAAGAAFGGPFGSIDLNGFRVHWTPDGQSVLAVATAGSINPKVPFFGLPPRAIANVTLAIPAAAPKLDSKWTTAGRAFGRLLPSPDGEHYAGVAQGPGEDREDIRLYAGSRNGAEVEVAGKLDDTRQIGWLEAPLRLVYRTQAQGGSAARPQRLMLCDVATRASSEIARLDPDELIYAVDCSRNGSRLVLLKGRVANAQLIEFRA
jgi:hypothetical protein